MENRRNVGIFGAQRLWDFSMKQVLDDNHERQVSSRLGELRSEEGEGESSPVSHVERSGLGA